MKSYLELVKTLVELPNSELKPNRTGMPTKALSGWMLRHDMSEGFPIITTRKMYVENAAKELEFFIRGKTDKRWLQNRGCPFWNPFANPEKAAYGTDETSKLKMKAENDLGPIYGFQWRHFNGNHEAEDKGGHDQLLDIVNKLSMDPTDRRMICSAWNPAQTHKMALPPCHLLFQVVVTGHNLDTLNLNWYQRSCDTMIGIPYDLILYGLLLKLLAKEAGMKEGILCGMLGDVHIYQNHIPRAIAQLERTPLRLPNVYISNWDGIFNWEHTDIELNQYTYHPVIKYEMSV